MEVVELGIACSGEIWGVEVEIGRVVELGRACSGDIGGDRESLGVRYSMLGEIWGDRYIIHWVDRWR